jgi:hypothetical protein
MICYSTLKINNRKFICVTYKDRELDAKSRQTALTYMTGGKMVGLDEIIEGVWEYTNLDFATDLGDHLKSMGFVEDKYPAGILAYLKERGTFDDNDDDDEY